MYTVVFIALPVRWAPVDLRGEAISAHTIQLYWLPGNETAGASYHLESYEVYFNDIDYRQHVRITVSPPVNSYILEDLTPNTVYYIRVAAKASGIEGPSTQTIQVQAHEYSKIRLIEFCFFLFGFC